MPRRSSPSDAQHIDNAHDLESLVEDKRASWRATGEKARRRQRRYKNLLTAQLLKQPSAELLITDDFNDDEAT